MRLVIVIPTYNERTNVDKLLYKVSRSLEGVRGWIWQILVVDGNSTDGTAQLVKEMAKRSRRIKLISERIRQGLGLAYLAGMQKAFGEMQADVAITMDADLSHQPHYLPLFLKEIEKGSEFVVGSRYIKGGSIPKNWSLHRKILSILGNKIGRLFLAKNSITDWTSGYRAITKSIYKKVYPFMTETRGYTFNISFAYYTTLFSKKVSEIPIKFVDREAGESKLGLEYLFHAPLFVIKARLVAITGDILKLIKKENK